MSPRRAAPKIRVRLVQLPHAKGLPLPAYQTADAAGLDLVAALPEGRPHRLFPGQRALIPTGLQIALPRGYEAQVRPRSGLALRHGITVLNSPGTIDADYRGEVQVILVNLGDAPFVIRRGERIAQMVVQAVTRATLIVTTALDRTVRGAGGFGSPGRATAVSRTASDPHAAIAKKRPAAASKQPIPGIAAAAKAGSAGKPKAKTPVRRKA